MKQSSLDITMNNVLDTIYNSNINGDDKKIILNDIKNYFINYGKQVGEVEQDKIKTLDCSKERRNQ